MLRELEVVRLTEDLPAHKLKAGDLGTVVMVYQNGIAAEVEFLDKKGHTKALVTILATKLERQKTVH